MRAQYAEQKRLLRQAQSLIKAVGDLNASHPLQPVWPGLATWDTEGNPVGQHATVEDRAIQALREPLSQFLKDAQRLVNTRGTTEDRERFKENGLVEVAFRGGNPERRRYTKQDCLADLEALKMLLKGIGGRQESIRTARTGGAALLSVRLGEAREAAGQSLEEAAAEAGVDPKAFGAYERGERQPRKNRRKLAAYIHKHRR